MVPDGVGQVTVEYDVSQIDFQGIYTAEVLITTNAQPIAKARSVRVRDTSVAPRLTGGTPAEIDMFAVP